MKMELVSKEDVEQSLTKLLQENVVKQVGSAFGEAKQQYDEMHNEVHRLLLLIHPTCKPELVHNICDFCDDSGGN